MDWGRAPEKWLAGRRMLVRLVRGFSWCFRIARERERQRERAGGSTCFFFPSSCAVIAATLLKLWGRLRISRSKKEGYFKASLPGSKHIYMSFWPILAVWRRIVLDDQHTAHRSVCNAWMSLMAHETHQPYKKSVSSSVHEQIAEISGSIPKPHTRMLFISACVARNHKKPSLTG